MKNIGGFVFIANLGCFQHIFGKCVNPHFKDYEALTSNGIALYENQKEAVYGSHAFKEKISGAKIIKIGKLEMKMAESVKEFGYFRYKESLIVVANFELSKEFFGPIAGNGQRVGYLPGTALTRNGLKTFDSDKDLSTHNLSAYEKAVNLIREVNRQGQSPATISTFSLKFIQ